MHDQLTRAVCRLQVNKAMQTTPSSFHYFPPLPSQQRLQFYSLWLHQMQLGLPGSTVSSQRVLYRDATYDEPICEAMSAKRCGNENTGSIDRERRSFQNLGWTKLPTSSFSSILPLSHPTLQFQFPSFPAVLPYPPSLSFILEAVVKVGFKR